MMNQIIAKYQLLEMEHLLTSTKVMLVRLALLMSASDLNVSQFWKFKVSISLSLQL